MNERIRELALKCVQQLDWDPPADPKEYHFSDRGLSEFAEAIVRECADIADINAHQHESPGAYVRQHFGVK